IRILRLGLIYPLDPEVIRRFATGLEEIIVVEEKRAFIEAQLRDCLYDMPQRPRVLGKYTDTSEPLFPMHGELDADLIVERLGPRLQRLGEGLRPAPRQSRQAPGIAARLEVLQAIRTRHYEPFLARKPNYCSGCPHNRSTRALEGHIVGGGIGCHGM